ISRGATDTQPLCDVTAGLLKSEWCSPAAERNSLPELPKLRPFELIFKLWLASQHDLQQLFGGRLQIQQESNFLQQLERKALRFVDDQHRVVARTKALNQP